MPRREPSQKNIEKNKQLELKSKLDSILLNDDMLNITSPDIPPINPPRKMDLGIVKTELEMEARKIMSSLVNFYTDENIIEGKEYLEDRKRIDIMSISVMSKTIRTAQHVLDKMIEDVDAGNLQSRHIEVIVQLQNAIMEMPKKYAAYITEMEKSYKGLKKDAESKQNSSGIAIDENGEIKPNQSNETSLKARGTKAIMEGLQHIIKNGTIVKDAEIIDEEKRKDLIDPRKKDLERADGISSEGDEIFNIDEDLF
jgi:hypothetical protein